jgi:beta-lactamase class D
MVLPRRGRLLLGLVLVFGCASAPHAPLSSTAASPPSSNPPQAASASDGSALPKERPELRAHFDALRIGGSIALFDTAEGVLSCSDVALCMRPMLPASTFKIANSMIGLETGVVEDAETRFPWDGTKYSVPEWNQDNDLRTAIRVSCVPCFQSIARGVGAQRMQEWVNRLEYGNRDISGGIDQFWLRGGMRISAVQQIDFLRRFDAGKLPISARTAEIVRDIITLDVGRNHVLLGKTGMVNPPEAPELTGWFVGFIELGERRVFFATLVNRVEAGVEVTPLRRKVTERVLRALQVLPSDAARAPD